MSFGRNRMRVEKMRFVWHVCLPNCSDCPTACLGVSRLLVLLAKLKLPECHLLDGWFWLAPNFLVARSTVSLVKQMSSRICIRSEGRLPLGALNCPLSEQTGRLINACCQPRVASPVHIRPNDSKGHQLNVGEAQHRKTCHISNGL